MHPTLALIGSVAGFALATGIILLWRILRRRFLLPTAIVGFAVLCYAVYNIVLLTWAYLAMRNDPMADMGPVWGLLALAISVVVGLCGLIALVQVFRSSAPWWKLFGCMIAEAGVAIGAGMLANEFLYYIAAIIRHGSHDIPQILHSYDQARELLSSAYSVLFFVLLLWEFGSPFIRRLTALPAKERRSPAAAL